MDARKYFIDKGRNGVKKGEWKEGRKEKLMNEVG